MHGAQNVTAASSGQREASSIQPSMVGGPSASWRSPTGGSLNESTTLVKAFSIVYLQNCPAASAGDTLTVQFVFAGTGNTHTITCEFAAYVFTGVQTNVNPSNIVDVSRSPAASSGTPTTSNLPTTVTDLILVGFMGDTGNISQGAAYTLGINMTTATFSQFQYILNQASGSISTAFSGTQTNYVAGATSLKASTAVAFQSSWGFLAGF